MGDVSSYHGSMLLCWRYYTSKSLFDYQTIRIRNLVEGTSSLLLSRDACIFFIALSSVINYALELGSLEFVHQLDYNTGQTLQIRY